MNILACSPVESSQGPEINLPLASTQAFESPTGSAADRRGSWNMKSGAKAVSTGLVMETCVHSLSRLKGPWWEMAIRRVNFNRIFKSPREFSLPRKFPTVKHCRLTLCRYTANIVASSLSCITSRVLFPGV